MISLLDTADKWVADWWLVFRDLPAEAKRSWFWRLLKPGFEHVELWRCDRGIWLQVDPCFELVEVHAHESPPWDLLPQALKPTVLHVQRLVSKGALREPLFFGPWTCVEIAKAFIGLRAPFARTPWQLYKRLKSGQ
jgi:hypothetical protein